MKRIKTLKAKFIISFFAISILYFIFSTVIMIILISDYSAEVSRKQHMQLAKDFQKAVAANFIYFNYMNLAVQTEAILQEKEVSFVFLFDAEGNEMMFRGSAEMQDQEIAPLTGGETAVENRLIGREKHVLITLPVIIEKSEAVWGYVTLGISLEGRDRLVTAMRNAALLITGVLFIAALLFVVVAANKITAPVEILKKGLDRVAMGDFSHRIEILSGDEFSYLADHFNAMAEKIEMVLQKLESHHKDLEAQVNIRTNELNETNNQLNIALRRLQETQQHIIQSEKQKSLMAIVSGFAHEINNPLTGISGYVELLLIREDIPGQCKEKLLSIQQQANRIKSIIDQLNLLNPEIEQTKMEINIANLLMKLIKVISAKPENKSIKFENHIPAEELYVFGNHFALWQVFDCVIENSTDAIRANNYTDGKVKIILKKIEREGIAMVEIVDNGGGIENLEKVFDPFFTTRNRAEKKGIGLSIVYNIIQEHRGKILVMNNNERGVTVTIVLNLSNISLAFKSSGGINA